MEKGGKYETNRNYFDDQGIDCPDAAIFTN